MGQYTHTLPFSRKRSLVETKTFKKMIAQQHRVSSYVLSSSSSSSSRKKNGRSFSSSSFFFKRRTPTPTRKVTTRAEAEGESSSKRKTTGETRTVVVTSGKGGVGKTTSSANLGMSMARLGYSVALVDADIGLRNLDLLLGLENRVVYTAMELLEGECRLEQALIRDKRWRNLALLPISKNRQRYNVTRDNMNTVLDLLKKSDFDFIFIDCPA